MPPCFDNIENESLDSCINTEIQAGVSEVGVYYAIHEQATEIPMPLNIGDVGYNYESAVTVAEDITFAAGKGFSKITLQSDTGEVKLDLVGNKGNKKTKNSFSFYVPGNAKKLLGFVRTMKNIPMLYLVTERDGQKRLIGDKFNPAYLSEVAGTTGKGGEDDKGIQFTIEAFGVPIVYEGVVTLMVPA
jgi:hypothetical protein